MQMKIFTSAQVRKIDTYTIENEPIESIDLMERASVQIASWITEMFDNSHPFLFLIRHNPSESILFLGRVADPTQ